MGKGKCPDRVGVYKASQVLQNHRVKLKATSVVVHSTGMRMKWTSSCSRYILTGEVTANAIVIMYKWYNDITTGQLLPWGEITDCGITTRTIHYLLHGNNSDFSLASLVSVSAVTGLCAERQDAVCWLNLFTMWSLQHPQIQKESQYIKYLCCDDAWTMNLWVTGIRIAKVDLTLSSVVLGNRRSLSRTHALRCPCHSQYGVSLYENYKTAEKKAAVSSVWTNRSTPSSSNPSTPSPTIRGSVKHKLLADVKQPRCAGYACIVCSHMMFLLLCQLNHKTRPMVTLPNSNQDLCLRYVNEG